MPTVPLPPPTLHQTQLLYQPKPPLLQPPTSQPILGGQPKIGQLRLGKPEIGESNGTKRG